MNKGRVILGLLACWMFVFSFAASATERRHTTYYYGSNSARPIQVIFKTSEHFTRKESEKLNQAFAFILRHHGQYWYQQKMKLAGRRSQSPDFQRCIEKYSRKDFGGINQMNHINNVMRMFLMNIDYMKRINSKVMVNHFYEIRKPNGSIVMGRAYIKRIRDYRNGGVQFNIDMNARAIRDYPIEDIAGTIFHEFMHNLGWDHPTGYPGSLIKEAGLCIARNNGNRTLSLRGREYQIID